MSALDFVKSVVVNLARLAVLGAILYASVNIRLDAVNTYGRVIHEFDPWFNFRATEYLVRNGWEKFKNWYDEEAWYPLGRHVGSTIYPGMLLTSAGLFRLFEFFDLGISLNDVCVFIPAGFSILSCLFTMGLAYEATRNINASIIVAGIMAIIPSHLMRSVAGGYDNESVAVAAIVGTFYFWVRSQRNPGTLSFIFAVLSGFSYIYMVAAWGGYVFVLNMIGVHAALLAFINLFFESKFNHHLHKCYSAWFVIGTIGALQFPIVGWLPFQSMEQLGPFFVFLGLQFLYALDLIKTKHFDNNEEKFNTFRRSLVTGLIVVAAVLFNILLGLGYVHGLSNRVRSLFIPHTHTGNPLVDSVAEHQSTPNTVYWHYFHITCYFGPVGFIACFFNRNPAKIFAILYCVLSGYFSRKMIRLVLLLAPAASISAGIGISLALEWVWAIATQALASPKEEEAASESEDTGAKGAASPADKKKGKSTEAKEAKKAKSNSLASLIANAQPFKLSSNPIFKLLQIGGAFLLAVVVFRSLIEFNVHSWRVSEDLSHPTIMVKARSHSGEPIIIDDFRQAYWFLRDKTPQDSRVMAWWDYGYQINGIGNRTTIADGNTWNHEHIALLGRCLISPEDEAHRMIRHLADYVLVWTTRYAGMAGDDLAKMPHMARIGGSVFSDINPNDYWMDQSGQPSAKLRKSLLYKLHAYGFQPEVVLSKFEEAYTSPNRMVRIYKVKNVAKRHPVGKYPAELNFVLNKSKAFKQ